jgi:hypothetical protein
MRSRAAAGWAAAKPVTNARAAAVPEKKLKTFMIVTYKQEGDFRSPFLGSDYMAANLTGS